MIKTAVREGRPGLPCRAESRVGHLGSPLPAIAWRASPRAGGESTAHTWVTASPPLLCLSIQTDSTADEVNGLFHALVVAMLPRPTGVQNLRQSANNSQKKLCSAYSRALLRGTGVTQILSFRAISAKIGARYNSMYYVE